MATILTELGTIVQMRPYEGHGNDRGARWLEWSDQMAEGYSEDELPRHLNRLFNRAFQPFTVLELIDPGDPDAMAAGFGLRRAEFLRGWQGDDPGSAPKGVTREHLEREVQRYGEQIGRIGERLQNTLKAWACEELYSAEPQHPERSYLDHLPVEKIVRTVWDWYRHGQNAYVGHEGRGLVRRSLHALNAYSGFCEAQYDGICHYVRKAYPIFAEAYKLDVWRQRKEREAYRVLHSSSWIDDVLDASPSESFKIHVRAIRKACMEHPTRVEKMTDKSELYRFAAEVFRVHSKSDVADAFRQSLGRHFEDQFNEPTPSRPQEWLAFFGR